MSATIVCPTCYRTSKPKLKVHELENDRITVTEICGFCRSELSQRESTNQIERIRRDIANLRRKIDNGENYLDTVLQQRVNTYNRLLRDL